MKSLKKVLTEGWDDLEVGDELAKMRGMGEDKADVIMSEFERRAGLSIKQKYWKYTKSKKFKEAAKLVYQWSK